MIKYRVIIMAEKAKKEKERIYTVPLRKAFEKPGSKRKKYAMKVLRRFISRNMKVDEKHVKVDGKLAQFMFSCSEERVPRKVRIKTYIDENGNAQAILYMKKEKTLQKKAKLQEKKQDGGKEKEKGEEKEKKHKKQEKKEDKK